MYLFYLSGPYLAEAGFGVKRGEYFSKSQNSGHRRAGVGKDTSGVRSASILAFWGQFVSGVVFISGRGIK